MGKAVKREGRGVEIECCSCRRRDNYVWAVGQERSLHRVRDLLCEVDGADILSAEGAEVLNCFVDLLCELTSRYENEG